jgi:hypothetical protein
MSVASNENFKKFNNKKKKCPGGKHPGEMLAW